LKRATRTGPYPAALAAVLAAATVGLAHAGPPSLAQCAAIASDADRLACYDRAAGRAPAAAPEAAAPVAPPVAVPGVEKPAVPVAAAPARPPSLIDDAWGHDPGSDRYLISLYHPNYFLFGRYSDNVNNQPFTPLFQAAQAPQQDLDSVEAKFQLSFKARLWATDDRRWGAWFAYTQQSQWQLYNDDVSRPFRDTNYTPEFFGTYRPDWQLGDYRVGLLRFGYVHQSNGRSDVLSRSWDRIFAEAAVERGNFVLTARLWNPFYYSDDNPDIVDYYGYGDLTAFYRWRDHSFAARLRGNIGKGKGSGEFTWTTPRLLGPLRGYFQVFSGYGESLIDYNWNQTTFGVGVALNDEF
jgi:phospholipase A1